jgi:predicted PurR-regulated permease PerM
VTVEREGAVLEERPLPPGRSERDDLRGTITFMPGGTPKIEIPRWIQLVGLPLLLVLLWTVAGAVRHVLFLFVVAALVALLLNPLVRGLGRVWIPRGFAVAIVYLSFAAAVALAVIALATVVVNQTRSASDRVNTYFTSGSGQSHQTAAERDLDRFQLWLDGHGLRRVQVQKQGRQFLDNIGSKDVEKYTSKAINWAEGTGLAVVELLFSGILIVVISIYMLLDMPRLARAVDRRFPPHPGSQALLPRIEHSLVSYVKGQALLSLIIGASAGVGLWLLGFAGWFPGSRYVLLFACWVAVMELIPYLGPWLGAVPPFVYALVVHPIAAIWVGILFLFIHQVEGHVVVPNVMGNALRLHPLLVIFGLLAGAEVYGLPGVLVALPLLAAARAIWEFFAERVRLESWEEGGRVPVDVELEPPVRPVAPAPPPEAATR